MNFKNEYKKQFINFYNQKTNKKQIVYTFFTGGLLFWLKKMLEYVPQNVNLILIGANLDEDEKLWISLTGREYILFDSYVDDTFIWELLFETNQYDFGWLDIDCFIFDSSLFNMMFYFPSSQYFLNAIWSWKSNFGIKYFNTYFLYISYAALKEIQDIVVVSPRKYVYSQSKKNGYYCTSEEMKVLLQDYIPWGTYPQNLLTANKLPYFDTMLMYETIAQKLGFKGRKILPLRSDIMQMYFSNEILHVGDSSKYADAKRSSKFVGANYLIYLEISYVLLKQSITNLPSRYEKLMDKLNVEIQNNNLTDSRIYQDLNTFLSKCIKNKWAIESILR